MRNSISKIGNLVIKNSTLDWIEECILGNSDAESCGFFIGALNGINALVDRVIFTKNINESSNYFSINPQELMRAHGTKEKGKKLIGIFHSHKKSPQPSSKDVENMSLYPFIWFIFGYTEAGKREKMERFACKLSKGKLEKITIKILREGR